MTRRWEASFSDTARRATSSAIRELLKVTEQPGVISLAGGLPAPEVFPIDQTADTIAGVLRTHGAEALQYSATEGYRPLRELLASRAREDGAPASVDNVLITTGSQQALDLAGRLFVDPGDTIVTESPTYLGALQAWTGCRPSYAEAATDDEGIDVARLEPLLRRRPKFIYSMPNFQNPSGRTLTVERRRALVELAARYDVLLVEDDPYRQLRYDGEHLPRLIELEGARLGQRAGPYDGNVIYLSTFSKILAPGLRVAWVIAPAPVIRKMVQIKQGLDLHTATLNQMVAYELLRDGVLDWQEATIRAVYRERRDAMLSALAHYMPAGVRWNRPVGGMFLWCSLPDGVDAGELLAKAIEDKVAFVPGETFHPSGAGKNTMRLNFSNSSPELIEEGVKRLGRLLSRELEPRQAVYAATA